MKINIAIALSLSLLISACASPPKDTASEAEPQVTESADSTAAADAATAAKLSEQMLAMQSRSTYFDFDKSNIKPEYRDAIEQNANILKNNGNVTLTLEGNADERGSAEYNLALGNRRANSVKKALVVMGVSADRVKVISLGEERPRKTCHAEKCWKENRRVDFVGMSGS